jgi:hypothetical protein
MALSLRRGDHGVSVCLGQQGAMVSSDPTVPAGARQHRVRAGRSSRKLSTGSEQAGLVIV